MAVVESTINKTSGDYTTIAAWEAATNLNSGADIWKGVITDSEEYDEYVPFDQDGTNDTSSYVWLTVDDANKHSGVWDPTKARLSYSGNLAGAIQVQADYLFVENLQVFRAADGLGNNDAAVRTTGVNTTGVLFSRCIFWTDDDGANSGTQAFMLNNVETDWSFDHCIMYGWRRAGIYSNVNSGSADHNLNIDHCAIYFCGDASTLAALTVRQSNGISTFAIYNTALRGKFDNRTEGDDIGRIAGAAAELILNGSHNAISSVHATPTNNLTDTQDPSAGCVDTDTANAAIVVDATFNPVTADTDFTPQDLANNVLLENGTNRIGSEPDPRQDFTFDIAGNQRPLTNPDIGPFEISNPVIGEVAVALVATLDGTSDGTGSGQRTAAAAHDGTGGSDGTGTGDRTADMAVALAGGSDATSAGARNAPLAAVLDATSDGQATGQRQVPLAGVLPGGSDATGTAERVAQLQTTLAGATDAVGTGLRTAFLASTLPGGSDVAAGGGVAAQLAADLVGNSDLAGSGDRIAPLQAGLSAGSDATSSGQSGSPLGAVLDGPSDAVSTGVRSARLHSTLSGGSNAAAGGSSAGVEALAAALVAGSAGNATGARRAALRADLAGASLANASGAATDGLAIVLPGLSDATGTGTKRAALTAALSGQSDASGVGTLEGQLETTFEVTEWGLDGQIHSWGLDGTVLWARIGQHMIYEGSEDDIYNH